MWGFAPTPEYKVGMNVWRNLDEKKFEIDGELALNEGTTFRLTDGDLEPFWVSIESLRKFYSKDDPWGKHKEICKKYGFVWRGPK